LDRHRVWFVAQAQRAMKKPAELDRVSGPGSLQLITTYPRIPADTIISW
jgi:hypothetical protein